MAGETALDLDFETGTFSKWSSIEAHDAAAQAQVVSSPLRGGWGSFIASIKERPGDVWPGNNTVRCLLQRSGTDETVGQNYYWGMSFRFPSGANQISHDNLLWELHNPASVYNLSGAFIAPLAVHYRGGNLCFRIVTGNGTIGVGFSHFEPNLVILNSPPLDQWIDVGVHISFSESSGNIDVWVDPTGSASFVEGSPTLTRSGIPTTQYVSSNNIHNIKLYTEMGLYTGGSSISDTDQIYTTGMRRRLTFADMVTAFGGGGGGTAPVNISLPVVTGSLVVGQTLHCTSGSWTIGTSGFTYQWQRDNSGGGVYSDIAAATSSDYLLVSADFGCHIRCKVTGSN